MNSLETAPSIFITGFPGFITQYLVKNILQHRPQAQLTLLVHPSMAQKAQTIIQQWGNSARACHIVTGDISQPQLGIDPSLTPAIRQKTQVVFHLAAIYDLRVSEAAASRANIIGTKNVLDFFASSPQLCRLNYISTCYVSGKRPGRITADHLKHDFPFHNFYESTKYAAEILVKESMGKLPITIFRPSIVVGDSQTGATEKFDGPYVVLKLLRRLRLLLRLIPNLGSAHAEANTVPVNYVVTVLETLGFSPKATGKTFQVCDPSPPNAETFYSEMVSMIAGIRPYRCLWLRDVILKCLRLKPISALTGLPAQTLDYFSHPGQYRCPEVLSALQTTDIRLPQYSSYYPTLYQYMTQSPQ